MKQNSVKLGKTWLEFSSGSAEHFFFLRFHDFVAASSSSFFFFSFFFFLFFSFFFFSFFLFSFKGINLCRPASASRGVARLTSSLKCWWWRLPLAPPTHPPTHPPPTPSIQLTARWWRCWLFDGRLSETTPASASLPLETIPPPPHPPPPTPREKKGTTR